MTMMCDVGTSRYACMVLQESGMITVTNLGRCHDEGQAR